ncbi:deoxycytidylate deaminase-like [Ruditapes philippinarum]|uniref:deoxycytidylate deaminase-like n=1 Tax=Ruditapes philippinarum TaxID=129788 RepID=UPI00295ABE0E|nr:deoxycytidylate deaminase-like [Ruditapes philippinarum]
MSDNANNSSSNNASPRTNAVGRSLSTKREDYLEWSDYFMAIAFLSAQRSKDPRTQVGACIVNEEKKIVGIGYNGMPNKCSDDNMPWGREADNILETKQLYVCHAELNAVLNKNSADVKNCSIYVALFPCNECAKVVIQSGIKEVIYYSDKYHERPEFRASKRMFDMAGVKYRQYRPAQKQIVIDFTTIDEMSNGVIADMDSLSLSPKSENSVPDSTS